MRVERKRTVNNGDRTKLPIKLDAIWLEKEANFPTTGRVELSRTRRMVKPVKSASASHGASSSYAMIFLFSLSLAQSRVKAALCSPGVRKLKSVA
jgi:hypothetical protein